MSTLRDISCEHIMDSLADGVFTVDADWNITFFNRAASAITTVPRKEAIGRKCWEVFRSSICDGACALRAALEAGESRGNRSIFFIRPDGSKVPISISAAPLRDRRGRVVGGVETFRDLSALVSMQKKLDASYAVEDIVSRSPAFRRVLSILPQVAASGSTVLVTGESGTGKELVARAIHNLSPRARKPFVAVNCGALPEQLLESELFGHKAGAFTDARRDKPGRFQSADGGTLFLDEIGDMPLPLQVKILRALQERVVEPLGATRGEPVNVRVIAATNRDLEEMVARKSFRNDLYYRLNVVRLSLPPLRERPEDIPLLARHFIARQNALTGKDIEDISPEVLRLLARHPFPGNVRELENIVEFAFILCPGGLIRPEHLPEWLGALGPAAIRPDALRPEGIRPEVIRPGAIRPEAIRPEAIRSEAFAGGYSAGGHSAGGHSAGVVFPEGVKNGASGQPEVSAPDAAVALPGGGTLAEIKRRAVVDALARHGGHVMAACRELGVAKDTLRRILGKG